MIGLADQDVVVAALHPHPQRHPQAGTRSAAQRAPATGEQPCWLSSLGCGCGGVQPIATSWGVQTVPSRPMALAMVTSLRIQATIATLVGLPRAQSRS